MSENQASAKVDILAAELREEVIEGRYGLSGEGRIPTVTVLLKRWNTTRSTVTAVLQLLQSEGIIFQKKASYIVNYPPLAIEGLTKNFEAYLRSKGRRPEVSNLIDPVIEAMPAEIAALFGQVNGVHVVHRMRMQEANNLPLRIAENWYPADLAGSLLEEMRIDDRMDVIGAITKNSGMSIVNSTDVVICRLPKLFEVKHLELVRTEPVVEIRRSNFAEDGTPLMWNRIIHRASQFQFTYRYSVSHWK